MLTMARAVDTGLPQAVQRTGLTSDAEKIGRRWTGAPRGAVAMLSPDDAVESGVGICEGTEDGIALRQSGTHWPIWATFGTGGLSAFPVLPGIEALAVFADGDEPGRKAAAAVAERWATAGRMVEVITPPVKDFNDLSKGGGAC